MKETEWVESVAQELRDSGLFEAPLRIETQMKLPYGYEVLSFGDQDRTRASAYSTDLIIVEDDPQGSWKPRVVVEAKVGRVTTHDAITYSRKAQSHRAVCPYLRYGIMLGARSHYPLPGRLYRHGENFDFMISFREHGLSAREAETFLGLISTEIEASRRMEEILYESRNRGRAYFSLLHRRLELGLSGDESG